MIRFLSFLDVWQISLLFLALVFPLFLTSQSVTERSVEMRALQKFEALALKNKKSVKSTYQDIEGSPFYYDQKWPADVITHDGKVFENLPLQIDLYAGEFVVTNEQGVETFLDLKFYKEIRVHRGETTDFFRRAYADRPLDLVHVLYQDEHFTLVKEMIVKHVESSLINGGQREVINKFDRSTKYDLIRNEEIIRLNFKKKKFYKDFSKEEKTFMKSYADKLGLKMDVEEDFLILIAYLAKNLPID